MKESRVFVRFGYRNALGSFGTLEESLQSRVYITSNAFNEMLKKGNFTLYGYDSRCQQVLFLNNPATTWLFIEYETY